MKKLIQPENAAEADIIRQILEQNNISARITSFYDTAYDGLFQIQRGWGVINVSESDYEKAVKILENWKASAPQDLPWDNSGEQD
ncbi:MAG: DUF2007 domain-containing protein [Desulfobia sp.]